MIPNPPFAPGADRAPHRPLPGLRPDLPRKRGRSFHLAALEASTQSQGVQIKEPNRSPIALLPRVRGRSGRTAAGEGALRTSTRNPTP